MSPSTLGRTIPCSGSTGQPRQRGPIDQHSDKGDSPSPPPLSSYGSRTSVIKSERSALSPCTLSPSAFHPVGTLVSGSGLTGRDGSPPRLAELNLGRLVDPVGGSEGECGIARSERVDLTLHALSVLIARAATCISRLRARPCSPSRVTPSAPSWTVTKVVGPHDRYISCGNSREVVRNSVSLGVGLCPLSAPIDPEGDSQPGSTRSQLCLHHSPGARRPS